MGYAEFSGLLNLECITWTSKSQSSGCRDANRALLLKPGTLPRFDRCVTMPVMEFLKTFGLFAVTALAEIIGCYLPYLWLEQNKSAFFTCSGSA